jgi:hypothetical protein
MAREEMRREVCYRRGDADATATGDNEDEGEQQERHHQAQREILSHPQLHVRPLQVAGDVVGPFLAGEQLADNGNTAQFRPLQGRSQHLPRGLLAVDDIGEALAHAALPAAH